MKSELTAILERVAAGELTPEEALRLIDGRGATEPATSPPGTSPPAGSADDGPPSAAEGASAVPDDPSPTFPRYVPPGAGGAGSGPQDDVPPAPRDGPDQGAREGARARTLRLLGAYRTIDIVADPTVAEAFVSGHHTARREGDVLVIAAPDLPPEDWQGGRFVFAAIPRTFSWGRGMRENHLTVRVHPEMRIELDVSGAKIQAMGIRAGGRIRLLACSLDLRDVGGPLDIDAMASAVTGKVTPRASSRIGAECSSVRLVLQPGSDLRVQAQNRMGKIVLPGGRTATSTMESELSSCVVGSGRDELQVEALMSSVVLVAGR